MKTTYSNNSDLAHAFAQRNTTHGRTGNGNLFYENGTIYSYGYHFPIAKFIDNTVLFTLSSYSNSTAKHISIVSSALSHYDFVYTYNLLNKDDAIKGFDVAVLQQLDKLKRARKPALYIKNILSEVDKLKKYCEVMNVKVYKKDYPTLYNLLKKGEQYFDEELLTKVKQQGEVEKRKHQLHIERKLKEFRNFETNHIHISKFTHLRYNKKTDNVETSKGIKIPKNEAKVLLTMWERNPIDLIGKKVIDIYKVQSCNDRLLIAGCHTIRKEDALLVKEYLK